MSRLSFITFLVIIMAITGCAVNYTTPAGGVNISSLTDDDIADLMKVEPAAQFPSRIAIARIQASGYVSRTNNSYGSGRYSVVTTRDIEEEADFEKILKLPMVAGVAPLNRVLLSSQLDSIKDLRISAARLKADLLLIYSVDTAFHIESTPLGPLSLVTLGTLPNKKAFVSSTTSGALIDVRTGYIYGATESTEREEQRANLWSTQDAIDEARIESERASFKSFVAGFEKLWQSVLDQYAVTKS